MPAESNGSSGPPRSSIFLTPPKRRVVLGDITARILAHEASLDNAEAGQAETTGNNNSDNVTTGTLATDITPTGTPLTSNASITNPAATIHTTPRGSASSYLAEASGTPQERPQPSPILTDAARVPPWQLGMREGDLRATPPSRAGGSRAIDPSRDDAYWEKLSEMGLDKDTKRRK
ncbi:hypothetical protein EJ05DRAFT_513918 [Pseudovirgaria hyperparasitica]|uniref:Uncharacterized protein n=1 Tax=Pseudovirgaria hyperparasitica TaxID=470096 RepID=A0A6A6VW95_9PEZI|nr:uncharacterized protein EJ05DRAFT_513918 [Pseudovirgaria hyperparasitica]KAF2754435.1 hypothetical protein EJ05DRAFT_513918 [Pseudovirgaria hyperparasitica]